MIITAGKWYKMRNGDKAFVIGYNPHWRDSDDEAWAVSTGTGEISSYAKNGRYFIDVDEESSLDLISLWQEPDLKPVLPEKFNYFDSDTEHFNKLNQLRDFIAYQQKQLEEIKGKL